MTGADGETPDLFKWECKIPGKKGVSTYPTIADKNLVSLGSGCVQAHHGVHRGLSQQATQVQIQPSSLPPKHLPFGYCMLVNSKRRRGLEAVTDHTVDSAWNPGPYVQSE